MKQPGVFLSYSQKDSKRALALEKALKARGLSVWVDVHSINAGAAWFEAIQQGIRDARAVVVLITQASASFEWVTFEYAFAAGAGVPVIAVVEPAVAVPTPLQNFQFVKYTTAATVAKQVDTGIKDKLRLLGQARASTPKLVARFQEFDGEICKASGGKTPALCLDLWVQHVPPQTKKVAFEILDLGFDEPKWTVHRTKQADSLREFLTDDMTSYGDIEIWAQGVGSGKAGSGKAGSDRGAWSISSMLYEALLRYYDGRHTSQEVRQALKQIRLN